MPPSSALQHDPAPSVGFIEVEADWEVPTRTQLQEARPELFSGEFFLARIRNILDDSMVSIRKSELLTLLQPPAQKDMQDRARTCLQEIRVSLSPERLELAHRYEGLEGNAPVAIMTVTNANELLDSVSGALSELDSMLGMVQVGEPAKSPPSSVIRKILTQEQHSKIQPETMAGDPLERESVKAPAWKKLQTLLKRISIGGLLFSRQLNHSSSSSQPPTEESWK